MDEDALLRAARVAMTATLVGTYGVAWGIAALPHSPKLSPEGILMTVSLIITLPYFTLRSCLMFAFGIVLSLAMIGVGVLIPPLGAIFAALAVGLIAVKFMMIIRNIPYVLLGILAYRALSLPARIGVSAARQPMPARVAVAIALGFAAIAVTFSPKTRPTERLGSG